MLARRAEGGKPRKHFLKGDVEGGGEVAINQGKSTSRGKKQERLWSSKESLGRAAVYYKEDLLNGGGGIISITEIKRCTASSNVGLTERALFPREAKGRRNLTEITAKKRELQKREIILEGSSESLQERISLCEPGGSRGPFSSCTTSFPELERKKRTEYRRERRCTRKTRSLKLFREKASRGEEGGTLPADTVDIPRIGAEAYTGESYASGI